MSSTSNMIELKSSDGESFVIEEVVARELQIIAHMIDDDCAGKPIPLQNVTGQTLSMVLEYCKKHVEAAGPIDDEKEKEKKKEELASWDKDFMKQYNLETLFELTLAANYLNIKSLLDLVCQTIADQIKDSSVEEVREIFKVENDYTAEEEEAIRKEHKWAFE